MARYGFTSSKNMAMIIQAIAADHKTTEDDIDIVAVRKYSDRWVVEWEQDLEDECEVLFTGVIVEDQPRWRLNNVTRVTP